MTAQVSDILFFQGKRWNIVAASEPLFFHPNHLGITPSFGSTACMKGFYCAYCVKEDSLLLQDLYVSTRELPPPAIGDTLPQKNESALLPFVYRELFLPMDYTGTLLLGDDFLVEHYVHMGYQSFWSYTELQELTFEKGVLTSRTDRSSIGQQVRQYLEENDLFFLDFGDKKSLRQLEVPQWWQ